MRPVKIDVLRIEKEWGGDKCTEEKCEEICKSCEDIESCAWLKETEEYDMFLKLPKAMNIKGYSLNKKIKVTWINASEPNILEYFITINEKDKPALRFNFVSDLECRICEFTIINLKNYTQYEIILYSRNKFGLSPASNKLFISPKKLKIMKSIKI